MTATAGEARAHFSQLAALVSETGQPITVFRNSRPWVSISPVITEGEDAYISAMADIIEQGMADYEAGRYVVGTEAAKAEAARRANARAAY